MSDDFSSDVQQALDSTVEPMDREWASDRVEIAFQVAPYTPLNVIKSGGVTVHYPVGSTREERERIMAEAKGNLRDRLRIEAWADMREHIAEYRAMVKELSDGFEMDQTIPTGRGPAPIPGPGNPARPAPAPAPKAPAPRNKNEPRDWGFVKRAVKAEELGHEDRYAVPVQEYTFDGETLKAFQKGNQFQTATHRLVRDENGEPNYFWKKVFGDWVPSIKTDKDKGKLSNSYIVLLIEGSPVGKATSKGNPYANVVGKLAALPAGLTPENLPIPSSINPLPLDRGALATYFDKAEDSGDDFGDDYDSEFDNPYPGYGGADSDDIPF